MGRRRRDGNLGGRKKGLDYKGKSRPHRRLGRASGKNRLLKLQVKGRRQLSYVIGGPDRREPAGQGKGTKSTHRRGMGRPTSERQQNKPVGYQTRDKEFTGTGEILYHREGKGPLIRNLLHNKGNAGRVYSLKHKKIREVTAGVQGQGRYYKWRQRGGRMVQHLPDVSYNSGCSVKAVNRPKTVG